MMLASPTFYVLAFSILEGVSALVAPAARAPVFATKSLGTSKSNFPGVYRDGGGGGVVGGKNIAVFSDTTISKDGKMIGFRSNTAVYVRDCHAVRFRINHLQICDDSLMLAIP